jgi:hypothetical protein
MGLSRKISVENRSPFCPYETSPHCITAEKVGEAATVAPSSFLTTVVLGTNTRFVYFLFFRSFSFVISTELIVEIFNFSVFSLVRC